MKKPQTNVEFLTHYMEWGSPLNQVFVMDAIGKLADRIVENEAEVLKSMEGSFVHGPAWVKCAKDYKEQYKEFTERYDQPVEEKEEIERKSKALYLTVRLDVEYPSNVNWREVVEMVQSEVDYSFDLDEGGITIIDTEICGENED